MKKWCFGTELGKCLEKGKGSLRSKFKAAEREDEIITCYETAGDLVILCMQLRDKNCAMQQAGVAQMADPGSSNFIISSLVEMAIAQVPLMHLQKGYVCFQIFSC